MSGTDNKTSNRASSSLDTGKQFEAKLAAEKYGTSAILAAWATDSIPFVGWVVSNAASLVAPEHAKQYAALSKEVRELREHPGAPRP